MVVGTVRSAGGPLTLALDREHLAAIPADVRVRLLPKSLAGERFAELVPPGGSRAAPIRDGAVIARDTSSTARELERVLDDLLPLLRAVDPGKLAVTLNALATALDGRGARLGADLATLGPYLARINAELPSFRDLTATADVYAAATPQLAATLRRLGDASSALVRQRQQLAAFAAATTSVASRGAGLLSVQGGRLIQLTEVARPELEAYARYSPEFGCLLRGLTEIQPRLDGAFAGGRLRVTVEPSDGRGAARPVLPADPGPDCHGLPAPSPGGGGSALLAGPLVTGS
jgi:phospholipid/cholesterol/gamma-HCH transport system substrate-binding protein